MDKVVVTIHHQSDNNCPPHTIYEPLVIPRVGERVQVWQIDYGIVQEVSYRYHKNGNVYVNVNVDQRPVTPANRVDE